MRQVPCEYNLTYSCNFTLLTGVQLTANGSLRVSFQGISAPTLILNYTGHLAMPSLECHDNRQCFQGETKGDIQLWLLEIKLDLDRQY